MRWFASVRIPGFGKFSPRFGAILPAGRRRPGPAATSSAWFWIGFFGVLWLAWKVVEQVKR